MYRKAFAKVMGHEGGYSYHPADKGGETFKGISRKYNPTWDGWELIDSTKKSNPADFEEILMKDFQLDLNVEYFYYENYWKTKRLNLERLADNFPNTASQLFDIAVNMGVKRAAKILQQALNILNRDEYNYPDVIIDGFIGEKSFYVILEEIKFEKSYLPKLISLLKAKRYLDIIEADKSQEIFIRGWINRVNF